MKGEKIMEKRIVVPRKMRKALRSYSPYGDGHLSITRAAGRHPIGWLLQMLLAILIIVILGFSAVLAGAVERPTPDNQTTIFDPSGTDPR